MKDKLTAQFIGKIPKSDLHLHLDGSLRIKTLIELAKKAKVKLPSYRESGMRELVFKTHYRNLGEYLHGFQYTCGVMQSSENLERVAKELVEDNIAEGVRYIEVRFAPQLHTSHLLPMEDVIRAVHKGLEAGARVHNRKREVQSGAELPFHYGIILCAMRRFSRSMSQYYADLIRIMSHAKRKEVFAAASLELARTASALVQNENLPIVGFDLAGEESGFPAVDHWEAYQFAHLHFIKKTVHAGEAYGPESIFQAITQCHANRIGHGTFLFAHNLIKDPTIKDKKRYVADLVSYTASQRIGFEVCPTSNMQTIPSIRSLGMHPIQKMIDSGLSVSICTDNRLMSNTSVTKELTMVAKEARLSRRSLRNLVVAGFKGSFFPGSYNKKRAFIKDVIAKYEALEKKFLPPSVGGK